MIAANQRPAAPPITRVVIATLLATFVGVLTSGLGTHVGLGMLRASALDGALRGLFLGLVAGLTVERSLRAPWAAVAAAVASLVTVVLSAPTATLDTRFLVGAVATLVAGIVVAWSVARLSHVVRTTVLGCAGLGAVIVGAIVLAGWTPWRPTDAAAAARFAQLSTQPVPKQYAFDGWIYLRVRDLMIQGEPFYEAFARGIMDDSRAHPASIESPFNIRQPLLFEVWKVLPGDLPHHLLGWFVAFSVLAIAGSYLLARSFTAPGPALVAPILMTSWLYFFWWTSSWFTMSEIWAGFVAVFALALLVRRRWLPSLLLLCCAVAIREFMVLLIPAWLVAWWVAQRPPERRRTWWVPAGAIAVPLAALLLHLWSASALVQVAPSSTLGLARWLQGGPTILLSALLFGWEHVPIGEVLVPAFSGLALVGVLTLRRTWQRLALAVTVVLMLLFLFFISHGVWAYYWGAFFTPIAVSLVPTVVSRWLPAGDDPPDLGEGTQRA